jgi:hypothetical protein
MRSRRERSGSRMFLLVLVDEDQKLFNVLGPITDDDEWNAKIVDLQKSGRNARCFSSGVERSVEELAALYSRQTGFAYSNILITEAPQRK